MPNLSLRTLRAAAPESVPVPSGGPAQHYADAEDYFQHHSQEWDSSWAVAWRRLKRSWVERVHCSISDRAVANCCGAQRVKAGRCSVPRHLLTSVPSPKSIRELRFCGSRSTNVSLRRIVRRRHSRCDAQALYNPDEVMREVARMLCQGGILYVDVPNEEDLYFRMGNLCHKLGAIGW